MAGRDLPTGGSVNTTHQDRVRREPAWLPVGRELWYHDGYGYRGTVRKHHRKRLYIAVVFDDGNNPAETQHFHDVEEAKTWVTVLLRMN